MQRGWAELLGVRVREMAFGLESDSMCGTWFRQLSSEATKQWFTQMLETRFNIQRAFGSVSQFLFFFTHGDPFPL